MIGTKYWSTGIKFKERDGEYAVSCEFFDNGFAQSDSSEGELRIRYWSSNLATMIDTLKADAERLGIAFRAPGVGDGAATIYCEGDGELEDGDYPDLRRLANYQAVRIGWHPVYSREEVAS